MSKKTPLEHCVVR